MVRKLRQKYFSKFSRTPGNIKFLGKEIGADNDEIFKQRLGRKLTKLKN